MRFDVENTAKADLSFNNGSTINTNTVLKPQGTPNKIRTVSIRPVAASWAVFSSACRIYLICMYMHKIARIMRSGQCNGTLLSALPWQRLSSVGILITPTYRNTEMRAAPFSFTVCCFVHYTYLLHLPCSCCAQFALTEVFGPPVAGNTCPLAQYLGEFNASNNNQPYILRWDEPVCTHAPCRHAYTAKKSYIPWPLHMHILYFVLRINGPLTIVHTQVSRSHFDKPGAVQALLLISGCALRHNCICTSVASSLWLCFARWPWQAAFGSRLHQSRAAIVAASGWTNCVSSTQSISPSCIPWSNKFNCCADHHQPCPWKCRGLGVCEPDSRWPSHPHP